MEVLVMGCQACQLISQAIISTFESIIFSQEMLNVSIASLPQALKLLL